MCSLALACNPTTSFFFSTTPLWSEHLARSTPSSSDISLMTGLSRHLLTAVLLHTAASSQTTRTRTCCSLDFWWVGSTVLYFFFLFLSLSLRGTWTRTSRKHFNLFPNSCRHGESDFVRLILTSHGTSLNTPTHTLTQKQIVIEFNCQHQKSKLLISLSGKIQLYVFRKKKKTVLAINTEKRELM